VLSHADGTQDFALSPVELAAYWDSNMLFIVSQVEVSPVQVISGVMLMVHSTASELQLGGSPGEVAAAASHADEIPAGVVEVGAWGQLLDMLLAAGGGAGLEPLEWFASILAGETFQAGGEIFQAGKPLASALCWSIRESTMTAFILAT